MGSRRLAKSAAVLERLERQAITLERLEALRLKASRLVEAGISFDAIIARRDQLNAGADDGAQYDFNDALLVLYDETFGSSMRGEGT
jgi:hypothetical protein